MGAQLREYRARIRSAQTTKKITRAMELIAASRIQRALARVQASAPYARAVTRAVSAVATYSNVAHVLTTEPERIDRAAIVILASDRGLAGAFNANALRAGEELATLLQSQGKEVVYYLVGRRAVGYFSFRKRAFEQVWTSRDSHLDKVPGFVEFHLLRGPEAEDHTLFASHTIWESRAAFEAWTRSDAFRMAHSRAGDNKPLYLEHPQFEGFEVRQTVRRS